MPYLRMPGEEKGANMEKRILGRTGLEVRALGMGGVFVSKIGGRGRDEACKAAQRALELGVNYLIRRIKTH